MTPTRWLCAVACLASLAACSKGDDDANAAPPSHAKDAGAAHTDKDGGGGASGSTGTGASGGSRADAGDVERDGGAMDSDAAEGGGNGGSSADAGDPNKCGGVNCAAPSICDHTGNPPFCVCPPGYHFVDVGGDQPPCAMDCDGDCDGG